MTPRFLVPGVGVLFLLASCKEPAAEYRLSQEQLSWQGYAVGQEMRFANNATSKVRTYRVTDVQDKMETDHTGTNWLPLPSKEPPLFQHITVRVQRTDTAVQDQQVLELRLGYNPFDPTQPELLAQAEWEAFGYGRLPLNEVIKGVPIDTVQHGATFLPTKTLGPTTYASVLYLVNQYTGAVAPGIRLSRRLYYAKGKGVVAYKEDGTGLWYRLP